MDDEMVIRPARAGDRPAMERICAHTWESGDYIQEVWDEWLADERGPLLVVEMNGQVVSLNKVTLQPAGQVWLEGMRVDPDYRGRGIASRCLAHNLAWARERGARVVRLATGSHNTAVHIMARRCGLEQVGIYALRGASPLPGGPRPEVLGPDDVDEAWAYLEQSGTLAHFRGLYSRDWTWQELSRSGLAAMLAGGEVVAHRAPAAGGRLAALATLHHHPGDQEAWIGLAGGEGPALAALLLAIRAAAAEAGVEQVRVMLPHVPVLDEAFQAAGLGPGEDDEELWLFELAVSAKIPVASEGWPEEGSFQAQAVSETSAEENRRRRRERG